MAGRNCIGPTAPAALGVRLAGLRPWSDSTLPTAAKQLPGHAELAGRLLVEGEIAGRDVGERGGAGLAAITAAHGGGDHEDGQQQAGGERRGRCLHAAASSAGSLVASGCSAGLASTWRGKRSSPTTKRPCPRGQLRR